jgi:hypothetical protein
VVPFGTMLLLLTPPPFIGVALNAVPEQIELDTFEITGFGFTVIVIVLE